MITSGIFFKNFKIKKKSLKIKKKLEKFIVENNSIAQSLKRNYQDFFKKKELKKYKSFKNIRVIGMGGSSLGTEAIYDFLKYKIKKNFFFINNLNPRLKKENNKKILNLIVSKSGNTIETIVNSNILVKKKDKNIFITENKKNYLYLLGQKLKADIIHHNNYIGGRYSVLSEVGMLPAELMGLDSKKFRQFNNLIKNRRYLNALISNVSSTLYFIKKKNLIQ